MNLIFQIIFTALGAFLSVILTRLLIQNGKVMRELSNRMDEGFRRMDERTEKMVEKITQLIVTEGEKTQELIKSLKD